ncbi:DUF433 domain-containing protein [Marivita sp. S6314]|uniref:DUF433 domain-containing protein n=1 Tax=Marivita sp. S6314 TaxID=2926406 RepID=UPI001FF5075C|nr:DUF433 domain-containing protein [Marivita sp. S6314]MCK0149025.1 DUF433 domain-containing protein [Marivita sp. S6314]
MSDPVVSAFTDDQAERLSGVSRSQLRYWDRSGFFEPEFGAKDKKLKHSRLYSFRDLACLRVLNTLRNDANVSLQHLRDVKNELRHLGDDLWSKTTLYVLNKKVVIDNPSTSTKEEVVSKQAILQIPLKVVSEGIRNAIELLNDKPKEARIERKNLGSGFDNVISGTRIRVSDIHDFFEAGYSIDQIIEQYPTLRKIDVEAALHFKKSA